MTSVGKVKQLDKEEDYSFAINFIRLNLQLSGTCPRTPSDGFFFIIIKITTLIFHSSSVLMFCFSVTCGVIYSENLDVDIKLINISMVGFSLILETVHIVLLFLNKRFTACMNHISNDWKKARKEALPIMYEYYERGRKFTITCNMFIFITSISWNIIPLLKPAMIIDNTTYPVFAHDNEYFFFDSNLWPNYVFVRIHQLICVCQSGVIMGNMCCIVITLTIHNCGQYETLISHIKHMLLTHEAVHNTKKEWSYAVQRHTEMIGFTNIISKTIGPIVLLEMIRCINATCLCGFLFLSDSNSGFFVSAMHLFSILAATFVSFIFCYVGEELFDKSKELQRVTYDYDWYNLDKGKRTVSTMLFMCSNPKQLTASGFSSLTLYTFSEIIKTTVAFLNMFRTLSE